MSDLREPHERPDTCSAAELADILDRFIALPSTEAIFKAAAKKLRAISAEPAQEMTDAEIIDFMGWHAGAYGNAQEGDLSLKVRDLVRHVEHRASRLPEMGEGDWPELPERNDA